MTHENLDDGLPVLNAVVESGNESIIKSSRLGRKVLHELDTLQQSNPVKFMLKDHILDEEEEEGDKFSRLERRLHLDIGHSGTESEAVENNYSQTINSEDEIEHMIDHIVDRHIHELRRDIRRLLIRVKQKT